MFGAKKTAALGIAVALLLPLASGCSKPLQETAAAPAPVHFQSTDECHVCGMVIQGFAGPKGQALTDAGGEVRKFCSTRELFSWLLQPENLHRNLTVYVHDMAATDWKEPAHGALIDAHRAFYVAGSSRLGAMGPALASFASRESAEQFAAEFGGAVLAFEQITLAHLQEGMAVRNDEHAHAHSDAEHLHGDS